MNPSGKVKFVYVEGENLPSTVDDSTMYIVGTTPKTLYIGSDAIGGGTDLSQDIISLNNSDDLEGKISFYASGDLSVPTETVDNLPLKDSYADLFTYELNVKDATITSETEPIDTSSFYEDYNLQITHTITVYDPADQSDPYAEETIPYSVPELVNLHRYNCKYLENADPYMYYYYFTDEANSVLYEAWSKEVPLAVDSLGDDSYGQLVSYDYDNVSVNVVDFSDLSNTDIVLFIDGERSDHNDFPLVSLDPTIKTNIIKYDSTDSSSETAIVSHLKFIDDTFYEKKSYGIFVDFIHGFMGEKYLIFPIWNNMFEESIRGNRFIKGAVTPLVEGEFAVFEYNTSFLIYSDFADVTYKGSYYCFDPTRNHQRLLVEQNPLGNKYPASYLYYNTLSVDETASSEEIANQYLHVEFSKNGLFYNKDSKELSSQDITNALEYTPADSALLGKRLSYNGITFADGSTNPNRYPNIKINYKQFAFDPVAKIYPAIAPYYVEQVESLNRIGSYIRCDDGFSYGYTLVSFGDEFYDSSSGTYKKMQITCPYNNKKYSYHYAAESTYYSSWTSEIYSNKVLVAIEEYDPEYGSDRQYIYYLEPAQDSSNDQLIKLEVTEDDTDFYVDFNGTRQTSGYVILTDYNEGYYVRSYELFDNVSDGLAYAKYYYDHALPLQDIHQRINTIYPGFYIDIHKRELYLMDFMESYNGRSFEVGYNREQLYWYQSTASNDPDHPQYSASATPESGKPIFYTRPRSIWKPYTITSASEGDLVIKPHYDEQPTAYTIFFAGFVGQYGDIYQKASLKFDYYSGSYAPIEETTLIREKINDMDSATKEYVDEEIASHAYTLPIASASTLGGVKIGDNLSIDENGVLSGEDPIQVSTMPEPTSELAGRVVQYIGVTNANYTNGYFYKCEKNPDGPTPGSYEGPDGNIYPYKLVIADSGLGGGPYTFFSMYPFIFCEENTGTSDGRKYYVLLTGARHASPESSVTCLSGIETTSNSKTISLSDLYPQSSSYIMNNSTVKGYYNNNQNFPYNWTTSILATNVSGLAVPIIQTKAAAYAYAFADPYIWTQVDTQDAYVLPTADSSTLGGVKVGDGLSIDGSGVLSVNTYQEIIDARTGVDGTTYADLGTAIRSQISDLASGVIAALNANY